MSFSFNLQRPESSWFQQNENYERMEISQAERDAMLREKEALLKRSAAKVQDSARVISNVVTSTPDSGKIVSADKKC